MNILITGGAGFIGTHLSDASMTLVWCSHVLEHIENHRSAINEIFRVLKPGGLAVIQVPIGGATTYEDLGS